MPLPQSISRLLIVLSAMPFFLALAARVATSAPFQQRNSNGRALTTSPSNIDFGNVQTGRYQTSYETLTNSGNSILTISQALVSGTSFRLSGLSLPLSLDKDQSVTFVVVFTPKGEGSTAGEITLVSNASNVSIPLSGIGIAAGQLTSSVNSLNFGSVGVGTSKTLAGTLTATASDVTIWSATSTSSEFRLGGLSLPRTIPAGQSASFTLTFAPQSSGTASGTISLISNAANGPTNQTLTGAGASTSMHSVTLAWNSSSSAVLGYNVYRSNTPSGPYTRVNPAPAAGTSYVDTSVRAGTTYYYVSTAVDIRGAESKYSTPMQVVIPSP